jgi:hemoglobin
MEQSIYEATGGSRAILALAQAWHRRCLDDPVVSHAFSHPGQHPHHVERLAAYWAEALGGPTDFTDRLGDHSSVLRMHAGNGEHEEMDERAQTCFRLALDDAGLPDDPRLRLTLTAWFRRATAEMAAYPSSAEDVPDNVDLPRWPWDVQPPATSLND